MTALTTADMKVRGSGTPTADSWVARWADSMAAHWVVERDVRWESPAAASRVALRVDNSVVQSAEDSVGWSAYRMVVL